MHTRTISLAVFPLLLVPSLIPAQAHHSQEAAPAAALAPAAAAEQPRIPRAEFPPGTIEFGLFGQYTRFSHEDESQFHARPALGFGGRLGVFVTSALALELDFVTASPRLNLDRVPAATDRDVDYRALAFRANHNFVPRGLPEGWSLVAGAGAVHTRFSHADASDSDLGFSALLGVRARGAQWGPVSARADAVADYMPGNSNLNLGLRIGANLLFDLSGQGLWGRARGPRNGDVVAPSPPSLPPMPPPPVIEPPAGPELSPAATAALLEPIFFDYESAAIRADAAAILERKLPWLRANPNLRLRLEGHADDRGADEFNLALGQQRAASTMEYLTAHGIAANRLEVLSFGEERPLCLQTPMTEACHQQNRRVEFRIVGR